MNASEKVAAALNTARNVAHDLKNTQAVPGYIEIPGGKDVAQKTSGVPKGAIEGVGKASRTKIDINKLDLDSLPVQHYDSSIGEVAKLQSMASQAKGIPGALGKDGPLTKVLENGYKGALKGELGTARGAFYELEVAQKLEAAGERVVGFGEKYVSGTAKREFDIITKTKLIECKNIDWTNKIGKIANKLRTSLSDQQKIAELQGKMFKLYSKNTIPADWKNWLNKKKIPFAEG